MTKVVGEKPLPREQFVLRHRFGLASATTKALGSGSYEEEGEWLKANPAEAENALRASGLDFTIVRPGGLKATPPTGELIVSKEDTLNAGEVSRDLVADVCVAALFDAKSANKVIEIIEGEGSPKLPESKWFA